MSEKSCFLKTTSKGMPYVSYNGREYTFPRGNIYNFERMIEFTSKEYGEYMECIVSFQIHSMEKSEINLIMWAHVPPGVANVPMHLSCRNKTLTMAGFPSSIVTNINKKKCTEMRYSYDNFFMLLDVLGEDWSRFRTEVFEKSKLVVKSDFFHKKRNLKGHIISKIEGGLFIKKEDGIPKEEYIMCKFEEDIDGSSLDGSSSKKNYLFLPKNAVGELTEEPKKSEKKETVEIAM